MSESEYLNLPQVSADPPQQFIDCYEWSERENVWRMTSAAKLYIAYCRGELDELERSYMVERMITQEAHDKDRAQLRERVLGTALESALTRAGVSRKMSSAAAAYLQREWSFKVDGDTVAVESDGSTLDLNEAVARWSAGDTGTPFVTNRKPTTSADTFTSKLNKLLQ